MKTLIRFVWLALSALATLAAPSQASAARTNWTCWLHADSVQAACIVLDSVDAPPDPTRAARPVQDQHELFRAIREHPGSLLGQVVYIPMHAMPTDEDWATELVAAVLCGRQPDCAAIYRGDARQLTELSPERFVDLHDPFVQMHRL